MTKTVLLLVCACTPQTVVTNDPIRELKRSEALADFDQMVGAFRALYGPLARKEARYGFTLDALAAAYRQKLSDQAVTESDHRELFYRFIGEFHDAHVALDFRIEGDSVHAYSLPFSVMPVGDSYVVYQSSNPAVRYGDELVSIDGESAAALVARTIDLVGTPNPLTAKHWAARNITSRTAFMVHGLSDGQQANVVVRDAAGKRSMALAWRRQKKLLPPRAPIPMGAGEGIAEAFADATDGQLSHYGAPLPFFYTQQVSGLMGAPITAISATAKAAFNVTNDDAVAYFATRYVTGSTRVLFIRVPTYAPTDENAALAYLRALFFDHADADVLVIDQTHNTGGSIRFAEKFTSLLAKAPFLRLAAQMRADRANLAMYGDWSQRLEPALKDAYLQRAAIIDQAYTADALLSAPIAGPFPYDAQGGDTLTPDPFHWTKPIVFMTDELSISCADMVPALIKANGLATLFGETTTGAGGNVETVTVLSNSRAMLRLTRSLISAVDPSGVYPEALIVEDNGVEPDVVHSLTLEDVRAGYLGYFAALNALVEKVASK